MSIIIDSHTHIGFGGGVTATAQELMHSMNAAKIEKSLVFASPMFGLPTAKLLEEISPYRDRLHAVASATLNYATALKDFAALKDFVDLEKQINGSKIVGLKFYTGYEHFLPNDSRMTRYLEIMNEARLPVIFHCGDTFREAKKAKLKYAHPLNVDDVAVDFPNLKIIIAHCGFPWHRDAAQVVYKNDNVYADCSGFVYGEFKGDQGQKFYKMLEEFHDVAGSLDKVIFGTDWPISDQKSYVDVAPVELVKKGSQLTKELFKL